MFGINIRIEDGLYRRGHAAAIEPKTIHCTAQVIEQQGFSFNQALKLLSPLETRRKLQSIFEQNIFRISEEEIRSVALEFNIQL